MQINEHGIRSSFANRTTVINVALRTDRLLWRHIWWSLLKEVKRHERKQEQSSSESSRLVQQYSSTGVRRIKVDLAMVVVMRRGHRAERNHHEAWDEPRTILVLQIHQLAVEYLLRHYTTVSRLLLVLLLPRCYGFVFIDLTSPTFSSYYTISFRTSFRPWGRSTSTSESLDWTSSSESRLLSTEVSICFGSRIIACDKTNSELMAMVVIVGFKHFHTTTKIVITESTVDRWFKEMSVPMFLPRTITSFEIKKWWKVHNPHKNPSERSIPGCINAITKATPAVTNA